MIDQSDLQDKELITRILEQYPNDYKFWEEVISICKTYRSIADEIDTLIEEKLKNKD